MSLLQDYLLFGGMNDNEDIQPEFEAQELQMEMIQAEQDERLLEQNSQRMIQRQMEQIQVQPDKELQELKPVRNPISPYMIFVSGWKQNHPEEKFNMSTLGQLWKGMELAEKEPYETQYKEKRKQYEEYQTALQLLNPNAAIKEPIAKSVFPLQRIRAIMRQDSNYAPKTQSIAAMAKGTEFFAEYLLEQVKRMSEGKNRINYTVLYDTINNVRSLSFLQCLIEEHNKESEEQKPKKIKPQVRLEIEPSQKPQRIQPEKQIKPAIKKVGQPKKIQEGQRSLDFFINKQK